mgnify:CR=1 FL=1
MRHKIIIAFAEIIQQLTSCTRSIEFLPNATPTASPTPLSIPSEESKAQNLG